MSTPGKWLHSEDEQHFKDGEEYDSREQAAAAAVVFYDLSPGDNFYTGQVGALAQFPEVDVDRYFEQVRDYLSDEYGEAGDDALDVSEVAIVDLQVRLNEALAEWEEKHNIKLNCFSIEDVQGHVVEQAEGG